jgi:peroxiredoxin
MVATPSTMLALGTEAPHFALPDVVTGDIITLDTFADKKAVLVMFICRHCKYVQHVKGELSRVGRDYQGKDIGMVAISANDANAYLDDAPESLKEMAEAAVFTFPIAMTKPRRWLKPIQRPAPQTFSYLIVSAHWSIEGNWTRADPAIRCR